MLDAISKRFHAWATCWRVFILFLAEALMMGYVMPLAVGILAFAGFNHGYMHIPTVEIGTQWLCAYLHGELELPSTAEMERSIEHIREWKRANIKFENARSCAVSTRFQQYIDIMLKELQVSPYRKLPNPFAELFSRYEASDYRGVFEEYERGKAKRSTPLKVLPLAT